MGPPHPELLKDEVLENASKTGITSLQSYVRWLDVEGKREGEFDFSGYDVFVEKLKKYNLKWVPFLIAGPAYSTPKWFLNSQESVFYKCLEHQKETGNQSIWNPNLPKRIEKFLAKVAEHCQGKDVLESILLGIAGNWGEAIYPTSGYWFGKYHSHNGFWAGDKYAREDFAKSALEKYGNVSALNLAWGADFQSAKEISFPAIKESKKKIFFNWLVRLVSKSPEFFKKFLKFILLRITKNSFLLVSEPSAQAKTNQKKEERRRWLDFISWYIDSMTNWADFWLKTARQYFPQTKIYLVTGGLNGPVMGADFSRQVKTAKKYNAGIRVTNQTNDYVQSCIQTRLISTATKFYNTYFTTEEEAVLPTPEGITMRLFDAVTSGASGFYCRNFISNGNNPFIGKEKLPIGQLTQGAANLKKYLHLFDLPKPERSAAVFFPNTSVAFKSPLIASLYNRCARLRDILDFDLVDENMIRDGALENYRYLLILEGELPEGEIKTKVEEWKSIGGILTADPKIIPEAAGFKRAGVYSSRLGNEMLCYDSNKSEILVFNKFKI